MTSSASSASPSATHALELINAYYASKPTFNDSIGQERPPRFPVDQLESLGLDEKAKENKFLRAYLSGSRKEDSKMPVHPAEEQATGSITDQVAKESKDSNASTHENHQESTGATSGGSLGGAAAAMAHKAHPGPAMSDNIGEPASKEDLKKRAEELNK